MVLEVADGVEVIEDGGEVIDIGTVDEVVVISVDKDIVSVNEDVVVFVDIDVVVSMEEIVVVSIEVVVVVSVNEVLVVSVEFGAFELGVVPVEQVKFRYLAGLWRHDSLQLSI
jgi:hypothetical protein